MEEYDVRKQVRKTSIGNKKSTKRFSDHIEQKNARHQKHDFKHKKTDIEQEELWEEWEKYYN
jgi:hypothetical protein